MQARALALRWGWAALCGLAFIAAFWPTGVWMAARFDAHDSFYSHGWLIPAASGWLAWQRRDRLARIPLGPSAAGLLLLAPAAAVHVLASWWSLNFISGFTMVAVVCALVWTLWGLRAVHAMRFPLAFLLFMVPLPGVLLISASFYMKLWAASMATVVLKLIGMPAIQAGSTIQVPGVSVIVDDTCSGLRSLISLIALAILWTSVMPRGATRVDKCIVVLSSIPIALAANMVRIVILVLVAAIYGVKHAEGFIHFGSGVVVFGVAIALLAGLSYILTHRHAREARP
jgi:exosortase